MKGATTAPWARPSSTPAHFPPVSSALPYALQEEKNSNDSNDRYLDMPKQYACLPPICTPALLYVPQEEKNSHVRCHLDMPKRQTRSLSPSAFPALQEEKNSNDRYLDTPKWKFQHHSDWVTSVKYVEDMNCVIAGSLDKFVSMTDAEERVPLKVLEGHTKGVTTVDWSPIYKFVCRCAFASVRGDGLGGEVSGVAMGEGARRVGEAASWEAQERDRRVRTPAVTHVAWMPSFI